jgi:hypothetical protein
VLSRRIAELREEISWAQQEIQNAREEADTWRRILVAKESAAAHLLMRLMQLREDAEMARLRSSAAAEEAGEPARLAEEKYRYGCFWILLLFIKTTQWRCCACDALQLTCTAEKEWLSHVLIPATNVLCREAWALGREASEMETRAVAAQEEAMELAKGAVEPTSDRYTSAHLVLYPLCLCSYYLCVYFIPNLRC